MNCVICKNGTTSEGLVTVTLQRGSSIIIIKSVPAQVCDNCGEYYLSDEVAESVLRIAEKATENNPEVEILQYAA
ncbi:MAG: type II toxin-antitoxin system MqsA family antitoxin [Balneolaceae bacterium]|nr:type II toxin-antitoxin system MqsA family antitoxin [Balneolaceae bacterium]